MHRVQQSALAVLAAVALGACSPVGASTPLQSPTIASPEESVPCGATGTVLARFVLPAGTGFGDAFPNAGLAPELEGVEGLELVVYEGEITVANLTGVPDASRQTTFTDAVCVIRPDGTETLYTDISHQGISLPEVEPQQ